MLQFFASIHSKDTRFCIGISELMIEFFLCIYTGCIDLSRKRKYEAENVKSTTLTVHCEFWLKARVSTCSSS